MKYRTKLLLACSSLLAFSTSTALLFSYFKSHNYIFGKLRSELTTVAASSAATLDGESIAIFTNAESTKTENYQQLIKQLRDIRDSNRQKGLYLAFVYIVKEKPDHSFYFIADGEENPNEVSLYGDSFNVVPELRNLPTTPFCSEKEIEDQWGVWFSAFAPILNDDGSIEAYLGIDKKALFLHTELDSIFFNYFIGFCITLTIGTVVIQILSVKFTKKLSSICSCVEKIEQGDLSSRVVLKGSDELADLATAINTMAVDIQEKERLTVDFGRYVSKHVLENILKNNAQLKLQGERKKVTVLFSDIREFTRRSESLAPEKVVEFLNIYFEAMIQIIFKYHGTLDKFIGDALLAEFGVPESFENQEELAVNAALEMQEKTKALAKEWKGTSYEDLKVGIGIHTGEAVIGNIGTTFRMDYTAIGDAVTIATTLENFTKEVKKEILISETTYKAIQENTTFSIEALGEHLPYGALKPLLIYSVTRRG